MRKLSARPARAALVSVREAGNHPRSWYGWVRFFRNQDKLKNFRVSQDLKASFRDIDAVVSATRRKP